jgi:nucleotide-binding universal stress UspA family protein
MAMRPRRILVGYDGSESGRRALDAAADLLAYGSTLTVITPNGSSGLEGEARERLLSRHVTAFYAARPGDLAEELLDAVRELAVDLVIVPGDRPAGPAAVDGAPCDVLLVR